MLAHSQAPEAPPTAGRPRRAAPHLARPRRRPPYLETLGARSTAQLRAHLGPLFVYARDALVVVDAASGHIVLSNPAAQRLFGLTAEEMLGQQVDLLMPPAVSRLQRARLAHYARTGDADVLNPRDAQALPALTRRGEQIHIDVSLAPLDGLEASPPYVLVTCRDGTQEKRLEQQALEAARAEQARAETQARLRQYEDLLHQGTRELRSLLGLARRAAARLSRMASSGQRLGLMARVLEARAAAVQRTLEQIDDVASIQAGTFTLAAERVNLVPLVAHIVAEKRERFPCHRLHLATPQGLSAACDPRRIEQVLHILIDQSIAHNPRGCWIDVDLCRPLVGRATIEVRDYGRHLSGADRGHMPDGSTADRQWYLCRYIVEQHGGSLSIEFPDEGGLRVNVSLPTNGGRTKRA